MRIPPNLRVAGQATLRVQHTKSAWSDATVDTENEPSGTGCHQYPFVVNRTQSTAKLHLDLVCLPPGPLSIRAKAFTTTLKDERRTPYSRGFLRVPGSYDLGGTAGSDFE